MSFLGSGQKHSEAPHPVLIDVMALESLGRSRVKGHMWKVTCGQSRVEGHVRSVRLQLGSQAHMGTPGQVGEHFREACGPEPSSVD